METTIQPSSVPTVLTKYGLNNWPSSDDHALLSFGSAITQRGQSFCEGARLIVQHQPNLQNKLALLGRTTALFKQFAQQVNGVVRHKDRHRKRRALLENFVVQLSYLVDEVTGQKNGFSALQKAENLVNFFKQRKRVASVVTGQDAHEKTVRTVTILEPLNTLTLKQKEEYRQLKKATQPDPSFAVNMADWEKAAIRAKLPSLQREAAQTNEEMEVGEDVAPDQPYEPELSSPPITVRNLPGMPNWYQERVLVFNDQNECIEETTCMRSGHLVPRKIKDPTLRRELTKENIRQLVRAAVSQKAQEFYETWGSMPKHIPVVFQSLLSPLKIDSWLKYDDNNRVMLKEAKAIFDEVKKEFQASDIKIKWFNAQGRLMEDVSPQLYYHNQSVNNWRNSVLLKRYPEKEQAEIEETLSIFQAFVTDVFGKDALLHRDLNLLKKNKQKQFRYDLRLLSGTKSFSSSELAHYQKKLNALFEYLRINQPDYETKFNDKNLFSIALKLIALDHAGIDVFCKSGNDRTAMVFLYKSAISSFYRQTGRFPIQNNTKDRKHLAAFFKPALIRMHAKVPDANTAGVDGIKNLIRDLPSDILDRLMSDKEYKKLFYQSALNSSINKTDNLRKYWTVKHLKKSGKRYLRYVALYSFVIIVSVLLQIIPVPVLPALAALVMLTGTPVMIGGYEWIRRAWRRSTQKRTAKHAEAASGRGGLGQPDAKGLLEKRRFVIGKLAKNGTQKTWEEIIKQGPEHTGKSAELPITFQKFEAAIAGETVDERTKKLTQFFHISENEQEAGSRRQLLDELYQGLTRLQQ